MVMVSKFFKCRFYTMFFVLACMTVMMTTGIFAATANNVPAAAASKSQKDIEELSLEDLLDLEIEVSSVKTEDIFKTPSTVSVIDKDMIRKYHFQAISEALQTIVGISVDRTYIKRNLPTSRGILNDNYANKVLVLLNGIPAWNAVTGEANIDRISIENVERIEVLRGPASVLYGTNGYSGAINIVLKKPVDKEMEFYGAVGDTFAFQGGGNFNYQSGDLSLFLSAGAFDEKGKDYLFTDENNEKGHIDEYLKHSDFTLNAKYKAHSFFINAFSAHESYLGVVPTFASGAGKDQFMQGYLFNYNFSRMFGKKVDFKWGVTYDWNHRNCSRSLDDMTRSNIAGSRLMGYLRSSLTVSPHFQLDLGADFDTRKSFEYSNYNTLKELVLDDNNMKDKTLYEYSLFAQGGWALKKFNCTVGCRITKNELFGTNLSSRSTLVFNINKRNSIKFIWGQSFRAPSLFEIYFEPLAKTVFGDENLEPETSNSFELTYLTAFGKFFVQALVYYGLYDNKIFRTTKNLERDGIIYKNVNVYINGSRFKAGGLELELKYMDAKRFHAFFNYSYTDGNNGDEVKGNNHYNFKYVPQHAISLGMAKTFDNLILSGVLKYRSRCAGPFADIEPQLAADFNIIYSHNLAAIRLQHSLSIKNAFDDEWAIAEYVRRKTINEIPSGFGRRIVYSISITY